jgi:hypothetical protein
MFFPFMAWLIAWSIKRPAKRAAKPVCFVNGFHVFVGTLAEGLTRLCGGHKRIVVKKKSPVTGIFINLTNHYVNFSNKVSAIKNTQGLKIVRSFTHSFGQQVNFAHK